MSLDYIERRIREALRLAKGNKARARKQVIAWAAEDIRLLQALSAHHLNGIVAYHIERVAPEIPAPAKKMAAARARKVPAKEEKFGLQLLKAVAGPGAAQFGLEGAAVRGKRGAASQQHMDAIRALAGNGAKAPPEKPKKKK